MNCSFGWLFLLPSRHFQILYLAPCFVHDRTSVDCKFSKGSKDRSLLVLRPRKEQLFQSYLWMQPSGGSCAMAEHLIIQHEGTSKVGVLDQMGDVSTQSSHGSSSAVFLTVLSIPSCSSLQHNVSGSCAGPLARFPSSSLWARPSASLRNFLTYAALRKHLLLWFHVACMHLNHILLGQ